MANDYLMIQQLRDIRRHRFITGQRERNMRTSLNSMAEYGERLFRNRYRMSKQAVIELLAIIQPKLLAAKRTGRKQIPPVIKLLITLRFLAERCFQKTAADNHGHSQPKVSRVIGQVPKAIASLARDTIVFPEGDEAKEVARGMYDMVKRQRLCPT